MPCFLVARVNYTGMRGKHFAIGKLLFSYSIQSHKPDFSMYLRAFSASSCKYLVSRVCRLPQPPCFWITYIGTPALASVVANVWRAECKDTFFLIPHARIASWKCCETIIGLNGLPNFVRNTKSSSSACRILYQNLRRAIARAGTKIVLLLAFVFVRSTRTNL